jgi:hypothetical protein
MISFRGLCDERAPAVDARCRPVRAVFVDPARALAGSLRCGAGCVRLICMQPLSGSAPSRLSSCFHLRLTEREHVRLGAWLKECDLKRPVADRIVLAYELVQAAVPEHAVPVLVGVQAV